MSLIFDESNSVVNVFDKQSLLTPEKPFLWNKVDGKYVSYSWKEIREKIDITYDVNSADYIINNYRDWKGITMPTNFIAPKNFKILYEIKIGDVAINTIYKKH